MLNVRVLTVGRLKEDYWRKACAEYLKRLGGYCKAEVIEVEEYRLPDSPSQAQINQAIEQEGRRLEGKIPRGAAIISLCIEGDKLTSPQFSSRIDRMAVEGESTLVFLIGGSYGLWQELKNRSCFKLSFSPMTFPHQMARVLLLEQLYRAFSISGGGKYHK